MKRKIVITDLTRMQDCRVCVAGYDPQGNCIRPVLPHPGIQETSLYTGGKLIIFPFAIVEYDLIQHIPQPPHTEDYIFDPGAVRGCGALDQARRRAFLNQNLFPNIASIFELAIHTDAGYYVLDGRGPRSLGTVCVQAPPDVILQDEASQNLKPRVAFIDGAGVQYKLAVTDLAWRYYSDYLRNTQQLESNAVTSTLQSNLRGKEIYLRIGLARGWSQHPERCYLQVTAIHTFPDYLSGRTFADYAPVAVDDDW